MSSVSLKNITKVYNKNVTVIKNMNLEIKDKEFIILVGPSGCGKSTLLRIIAGLEGITEGEIFIGDKNVTNVPPKDRDISMVFQNYALYPHMTVYKNMAFGLENRKIKKDEIKKKISDVAKILDIENLLDRKPKAMSGGQQQRVALGRAMVREPNVFLLDEPLSNLDAKLRTSMRSEIVKLHNRVNTTFVYVTHDQVEAMTMGDRIVIMKDGYIQQIGTPKEIYDTPKNKFVAGFIGTPQMNFFNVNWKEKEKRFYLVNDEGKELIVPLYAKNLSLKNYDNKQIILGIRPEHISLKKDGEGFAKVDMVEHLGSESYIHLNLFGHNVIMKTSGYSKLVRNDKVSIQFSDTNFNLFDLETEQVIK